MRLYPIIQDTTDRTIFLDIFRSYVISSDAVNNESLFDYYVVQDDDWFDNISFKHYNTPYLWWVVALFNNINNPYESLEEGQVLKILKYNNLYKIFDDFSEIEGL